MIITSLQNPKIKQIVALRKANKRKKQDLFVIDGLREIKVALDYGFQLEDIFYCPELSQEKYDFSGKEIYETSKDVFKKTAYAAGVDAVIINETQTDLYNPNVIKASSGHVFSSMVIIADKEKTLKYFLDKKINIYATSIKAAKDYTKINWQLDSAIVFGSEAQGLSDFWLERAKQNIIIPMQKGIDSLNVSVSAGIIVYEAQRQRNLD
jgi:TrmH family RNA methyltransferase